MFRDVDETIGYILTSAPVFEPGQFDVSFEIPNREWSFGLARPTFNCYLFDVQIKKIVGEDMDLFRQGAQEQFDNQQAYFSLKYLVSAWTRQVTDEHLMLAIIAQHLSEYTTEDRLLDETLIKGQLLPFEKVYMSIGFSHLTVEELTNLWISLENNTRPAFVINVKVPFRQHPSLEQPTVDEDSTIIIDTEELITPQYLSEEIAPLVNALAQLQVLVGEDRGTIRIRRITQFSPTAISVEGILDALNMLRDMIIPWRRAHAENMARLTEEHKAAEIAESQARTRKELQEAEKIAAEATLKRIEVQQLQLSLDKSRLQLALDMASKIVPDASETERIAYAVKILEPIKEISRHNLSIQ